MPERWTGVLDELTRIAGGIGGAFLVPSLNRWMATPGIEEMMSDLVSTDLINRNERTRSLLALQPVGFYRDLDIFNLEDLPGEPVYRDFFIPRGGGFGTATVVDSPTGDTMILHIERAYANGLVDQPALDRLNGLRPHLARASLLSARVQMATVSGAAGALEALGIPGAIVDRFSRVIGANGLIDKLVPGVIEDRRSRIKLVDKRADQLLENALAGLAHPGGGTRAVRSIPVPAAGDTPPAVVHIVPVRGLANDVFSMAQAIVLVTLVSPKDVPSAALVQGLFDLTPAEGRIARELARGNTVSEVAHATGRSVSTVRNQVKAVLDKTGLHRQADLVGLLRGVTAANPWPED